jgi:cytochrome c
MLRWVLAAGLMIAAPAVASAQDAEAGKKVFTKCAPCHSIGPGATNKVGPNLNGLFGRKAGTEAGFNYSDAMKNAGWNWDEAIFKEYITDPKKKVPGNKMLFPGVKDELERDDLAAYVGSFNADGTPKK